MALGKGVLKGDRPAGVERYGRAMSGSGYREQAGAWARVARAAARVHGAGGGAPEANGDLFDAIELAATHGRLDLGELVDAYLAGAPDLDVGEAWGDVEAYLERVAHQQEFQLDAAFKRAQSRPRLLDWPRQLRLRVDAHGLALAEQRAFGGHADEIEQSRLAVVELLERAKAADATEEQLDAFLRELRIEQCDLLGVVDAAGWIARERAARAMSGQVALPGRSWATVEEIACDRGVPPTVAQRLIREALQRGLLAAEPRRGVVVTAAGSAWLWQRQESIRAGNTGR